jgi:phosphomannomutase
LDGASNAGCVIDSYGVLPIPLLGYATSVTKCKGGAYISASHNPPEYNGIRFRTKEGYGMLYRESGMMDIYLKGEFLSGPGTVHPRDPTAIINSYKDAVSSKLDLKRGLKIVLDMGNGSACIMKPLYEDLGFKTIVQNGSMDGRFPGRGTVVNEETLIQAAQCVLKEGADYGVGFDPDADCAGVIDEKGRVLPPEKVAIILAKIRYNSKGTVVSGFDCSMVLERVLEPLGVRVLRERVGDVFISNTVKTTGAVIGVERSGHFFIPEFQYSDDPFAMSLALGEIVSQGEHLSDLADAIPDYPYLQRRIDLKGDPKIVMNALEDLLASQEPDTTDGLKITKDDYTVLIRPSNTEPLIRIYVETTGQNPMPLADKYQRMIKEALRVSS